MNIFVLALCAVSIGQSSSVPPVTPPKVPQVSEGKTVTLGKVGQAKMPAAIYAKSDIGSHVVYELKAHEYVVVKTSGQTGWLKVLLSNGQHGFVQADALSVLEYDVTTVEHPRNPNAKNPADLALSKLGPVMEKGQDSGKFVQSIFSKIGVKLSAKPSEQVNVGKKIARLEDLKKGDRVYFWDEKAEEIGQVGVYVGNGYMVHLNDSKGAVETVYIGSKDWLKKLVEARR